MTGWTPTNVEISLLKHIIKSNGPEYQLTKSAEEYAEASAAISRFINDDSKQRGLIEELADTQIMQAQIFTMHPGFEEKVAELRTVKLCTLAARFEFPETLA